MGACHVLQNLCQRTLCSYPLSQPVRDFSPRNFKLKGMSLSSESDFMASPHYHRENKPKKGGICVANHTSPIDIVILCNDGGYAMVQKLYLLSRVIFQAKSWHYSSLNV